MAVAMPPPDYLALQRFGRPFVAHGLEPCEAYNGALECANQFAYDPD